MKEKGKGRERKERELGELINYHRQKVVMQSLN